MQLITKAFAKVNLTLDCVGKREDGYHLLRSIMQPISLYDTVSIECTGANGITVICDQIPHSYNLATKAAHAFFHYAKISPYDQNIKIHIDKNIPVAAGLGGGSTDAAIVINLLNNMFSTRFDQDDLIKIALEAGADVPFCLFQAPALVEGIGEKITLLAGLPELFFVLVKPSAKGSTTKMYQRLDEAGISNQDYTEKALLALKAKDTEKFCTSFGNAFSDLWKDAHYHHIRVLAQNFGALNTSLTGSGPTVFSVFDKEESAQSCYQALSCDFTEVFLAKTINSL